MWLACSAPALCILVLHACRRDGLYCRLCCCLCQRRAVWHVYNVYLLCPELG
jgi:hypothetical protein